MANTSSCTFPWTTPRECVLVQCLSTAWKSGSPSCSFKFLVHSGVYHDGQWIEIKAESSSCSKHAIWKPEGSKAGICCIDILLHCFAQEHCERTQVTTAYLLTEDRRAATTQDYSSTSRCVKDGTGKREALFLCRFHSWKKKTCSLGFLTVVLNLYCQKLIIISCKYLYSY